MKSWWGLLKQTVSEFMEDRAMRLSAALAYYAVFSIGPLLVLIVGVVGLLLGDDKVRQQVHQYLSSLLGESSTSMVESMMQARQKGGSLLATITGGVALVLGASGVFGQLQDSLNTIWEVQPKSGQGIRGFIRHRFLSISIVLSVGFLLLVSMVLTTVVQAFAGKIGALIGMGPVVAQVANYAVLLTLISVLFAAIFKVLPDVQIRWRDVWVGAFLTAVLFLAGQFLLSLYLASEATRSSFGAASAFVIILLYIYYASVILFFGAEFTQVYAHARGAQIQPSEHAVAITESARAQQGMKAKGHGAPAVPGERSRPERQASTGPQPATATPLWAGVAMTEKEFMTDKLRGKESPMYRAPLEQVQAQPWSFVLAGLGAGLAAGYFMKASTARKILKYYLMVRRFV